MAFSPEKALFYLKRSRDGGRLGHAYLVHGPDPELLQDFATKFLNEVLGTSAKDLDELQMKDAIRIVRPESKSRKIVIEQIRELEHSLHLKDQRWPMKIGVLEDADRLQPQAENAFLKTLEEPPDRCMILLLSTEPEQLLDTVLSRCIKVPLFRAETRQSGPDEVELRRILIRHVTSGASGVSAIQRLQKEFTSLLASIKEECNLQQATEYKQEVARYGKTTGGDWLDHREEQMEALAKAHYLQRRSLLLTRLVQWFGDIRRIQSGVPPVFFPEETDHLTGLATKFTPQETMRRYRGMEQLYQDLNTNVSEPLALEVAFLESFA